MRWMVKRPQSLIAIEDYAKRHGIKIIASVLEGEEHSRKPLLARPAFKDMMIQLHIQSIDIVLSFSLRSISPWMREQEILRAYLSDLKVKLLTLTGDPIESARY